MRSEKEKSRQVKKKGAKFALQVLDSLLKDTGRRKITEDQVMIILDALAGSEEPALITRFPAVLSICARNSIALNSQSLFSRYWDSSPKRQNLEKLLLVSEELFNREKIKVPENLKKIADSLKTRHPNLLSLGHLQLSSGVRIPMKDFQDTLRNYFGDLKIPSGQKAAATKDWSAQTHIYLDRLFSPKQKELVFKRIRGEPVTKTEREYYSRVVRKKLEAIVNDEIREIATALIGRKSNN